jgi:hypothetical protein
MRNSQFNTLAIFLLSVMLFESCKNEKPGFSSQKKKTEKINIETPQNKSKQVEQESFDMTNPAFMMGTNIGAIFKAYYKVGDFNKMITYTASSSIKKYGREKLRSIYRNLDLGFDMKFKNMTIEGNEKILHYEVVINATKMVKRLHVVIENDTARIVPKHLEKSDIFE